MSTHVHDVLGIGVGPFNLGLAALADPIDNLDAVFWDARPHFDWHPGLMLDDATLQVPFLADLVTMADPTSRWSFLNWLKATDRLYPYYLREHFHPLRREYADYCRWVADRLPSVWFGRHVVAVEHDGEAYVARAADGASVRARRLVIGVGSTPRIPACLRGGDADGGGAVVHTADYLGARDRLQQARRITIIGSGQSAAEVYHDLLAASPDHDYELVWITRSPRFFPLEYTKLTLELTSPEYTDHFHALPEETRERLGREQRGLYKGISGELVDAISDLHHRLRAHGHGPRTTLVTHSELLDSHRTDGGRRLEFVHRELGESFSFETDAVVCGTGYGTEVPAFLAPIRDRLLLDERGRYRVTRDYAVDLTGEEIFVQNAEEHTHGLSAPDLGMGAYRNSVILRGLLGREVYPVERRVAVQTFGVPHHLAVPVSASSTAVGTGAA
ncbi:SidA/IucD/PvdA family monooxygenase [Nocardioides fonticola]|uniref:L-lysine N6-monooxygenase MbtG n=1 Tax=Nocardioides fonticola TaxID=450363 RepID=A0ABP7XBQ8_9ACTN